MLLSQAVQKFMLTKSRKADETQRFYNQTMSQFVKFTGDPEMERFLADEGEGGLELVQRALLLWETTGIKKENGPATLNARRSHLMQFFDWAFRRRLVHEDGAGIMKSVGWDNVTVAPRKWTIVDPAEMLMSLDLMKHPLERAFIALCMYTGLRQSEMVQLRVEDVFLDANPAYLRAYLPKQKKYINKPITPVLDRELRDYLTWYTERLERQGLPLTKQCILLPAKARGQVRGSAARGWSDNDLQPTKTIKHPETIVHRMLTKLGVNEADQEREGIHTLRRSFGRAIYEFYKQQKHQDPLRMAQVALGHASRSITERYLGLDPETQHHIATLTEMDPFESLAGFTQTKKGHLRSIAG